MSRNKKEPREKRVKKEKVKVSRSPIKKWINLSKKKKRLVGIIAALTLLIMAAGYTVFIAPLLDQEQWVYKEAIVERGILTVGVSESGSLEYGITNIDYDLNLDVSDDDEEEEDEEEVILKYLKLEKIYVASGQRINEGDALLKFTDDSVTAVRKLLQNALVDYQVAYNEAESEYNLSVLEAKIDYDTQKVSENYASSIYKAANSQIDDEINSMQVEIEQRTRNIASLQEKLADAQEDYAEALETYEDAKEVMELVTPDHVANFLTIQGEYLSAQTKYQSTRSALEQAQENLSSNTAQIESLQSQITAAQAKRSIERLDAEQTYQESRINGENAATTYNAQLESLKEVLQEAEDDKTRIEEQIEAFEAFVGEDGILYADGSGIVTSVNFSAGDTLTTTGTMISYAKAEGMTTSVDVTQEDIVSLKVGDEVDISFRAYEDAEFTGKILSIDTTATSTSSATVSYTVVIGVEGETELLYGGMSADITFVMEEKEDVLYISKKAIVEENGRTYVYVSSSFGGRELKEVVTGLGNSVNIEIVSGLEEGDTIYIASRVSSEAEAQDTSQSDSSGSSIENTENTEFQFNGSGGFPEGMSIPQGGEMNGMEGRP